MIDFETWWNSSSADEFRRLNDDMDGRVVRPVWDAAIRATLSSQKATSAAPSPEATRPTQAEAPSERARAWIDAAPTLTELAHQLQRKEAQIAELRVALATQQAGQGEHVGVVRRQHWLPGAPAVVTLRADQERALKDGEYVYTATPPAPGQVERDREDAENWRWLTEDCDGDAQDDFIRWLSGNVASKADIDTRVKAIRAARSSEGGDALARGEK